MSFPGLLDSEIAVWRPHRSPGDYGDETPVYVLVGSFPCAVRRPSANLANTGPGLTPTGSRRFYLTAEHDIRLRDVCVLSGADTGRWEVNEPPTRPRGHHLQLDTIAWAGRLPGDGES